MFATPESRQSSLRVCSPSTRLYRSVQQALEVQMINSGSRLPAHRHHDAQCYRPALRSAVPIKVKKSRYQCCFGGSPSSKKIHGYTFLPRMHCMLLHLPKFLWLGMWLLLLYLYHLCIWFFSCGTSRSTCVRRYACVRAHARSLYFSLDD
jgi:hypothetical protein